MVDGSEDTDLKIVDFGLSKIVGPSETSLDPFGTLVSYYTCDDVTTLVLCSTRSSAPKALRKGSRLVESRSDHLPVAEPCSTVR